MQRPPTLVAAVALLFMAVACSPSLAGTPSGPTSPPAGATVPFAGPSEQATAPAASPAPSLGPPGVAGGPPAGRYLCYLVPAYIYSGWVELRPDGSYLAGYSQGEPTTEGRHTFDALEGLVRWEGGSYEQTWPIAYHVAPGRYPDGSERTGTGADRHTIALKVDQSNPRLPGQETAGNPIYVYCYLEPPGS